jgi:hypothetical protein
MSSSFYSFTLLEKHGAIPPSTGIPATRFDKSESFLSWLLDLGSEEQ